MRRSAFLLSLVMLAPLLPAPAPAANEWAWSAGNSNWNNTANWSSNRVPIAGEDVIVSSGTVELTNDTAILKSLTLTSNARLHVYSPATNGTAEWGLQVNVTGTLSIAGGSWIYPYSHYTNGGSPRFLCSNLVVDATSGFDASEKGYAGGLNAFRGPSPKGYGPGGSVGSTYSSGGGGYGGRGGTGFDGPVYAYGGSTYGSYTNPADPGSGAGGSQGSDGMRGGGLVRVEAIDSVIMDGSVLARGRNGPGYPGAGSGGGIYIKCTTFQGSGVLRATGGDDVKNTDWRNGGAGGGGRIAVVYDTTAQAGVPSQPTVRFNAAGGSRRVAVSSIGFARQSQGRPGSLYLSDTQFFSLARVEGGTIMVPGVTSWATNALWLTNDLIAFPAGFSLSVSQDVNLINAGGIDLSNSAVSIGGSLIIDSDRRASVYLRGGPGQHISIGTNVTATKGWIDLDQQGVSNPSLNLAGNLTLNDANLEFRAAPTNFTLLSIGDNLVATNGARVYLYCGMTNGFTNCSVAVDVLGDIAIASNCWVYPYSHYTNGGSAHFSANAVTVGPGGGIDANGKGYSGGLYAVGGYNSRGFGPGGGPGWTMGSAGGGYGGMGGNSPDAGARGGPTYGESNAPAFPGSGGGSTQVQSDGGYGGGLIHLQAGKTVAIDGSFLASGTGGGSYNGPGSGGGIYISCRKLTGAPSGRLRANGGAGVVDGFGNGGGGGGRIAVWTLRPPDNWLGTAEVYGGAEGDKGYLTTDGTNGTIFWGRLQDKGTVFVAR